MFINKITNACYRYETVSAMAITGLVFIILSVLFTIMLCSISIEYFDDKK